MAGRIPVWKSIFAQRLHMRLYARLLGAVGIGLALGFSLVGVLYYFTISVDLGSVLDWLVLILPIVAGLLQWIFPVTEQTLQHRIVVFSASLILSGLIFWQQSASRKAHEAEMSRFATKRDIPTAADFARELVKLQKPSEPHPTLPSSQPRPPQSPDVAMRFVNPADPFLVLEDTSSVLARDIKWFVVVWNADLPDRDDPLPIPVTSFDWLKAHTASGPIGLFDSPLVKPLIKNGDHILGSAVVTCPTCSVGHSYILSITFGTGGWYAEDQEVTSGELIVPTNFQRGSRENFQKGLATLVPEKSRIQIGTIPVHPARPIFQ